MKRIFYFFLLTATFLLPGCFDTAQEITLRDDGSGVFTNKTDLSSLMAMMSQMGSGKKQDDISKDTTLSLAPLADSISNISAEEKMLLTRATMNVNMNTKEEKFVVLFHFPYSKLSDIALLNQLCIKVRNKAISDQLKALSEGGNMPGGDQAGGMGMDMKSGDSASRQSEVADYFITTYGNGSISSKLNKEKYAGITGDEDLKSLQELSQLGIPMDFTYVINLPRPAKKAEGKAVKISDDRKTISIKASLDDLFDEPSKFEYEIEY